MNGEHKISKGGVSNFIAWVFIVLQVMMTLGGLYAGGSRERIAFFNNSAATVQSVVFVTGLNILGIGALILSLIVWRYHKNKKGKVTTFAAVVVIILNTLCSYTLVG